MRSRAASTFRRSRSRSRSRACSAGRSRRSSSSSRSRSGVRAFGALAVAGAALESPMLSHVVAMVVPLLLAGPPSPSDAQAALKAGDPEEALALFKKAASRDKRCGACFFGMAEAQYALREYRDAVKSCSRALELEPADPRSRARAH